MSSANPSHCVCPTPEVINVPGGPGIKGNDGTNGTDGTDGINPFTLVAGSGFTVPAADGVTPVTIPVLTSVWGVVGENIFVQGAGVFQITAIPGTGSFTAVYLKYSVNTNSGASIAAGNAVSPTGYQTKITGVSALTDGTGGAVTTTLAGTVGVQTLAFYMTAADMATGDLLTDYVPGYAFQVLKFDARCAKPVTTAAKASTISLEINAVAVTGGSIALAGTYVQGAAQAGTTVTGTATGAATDSISILSVTSAAFIEGAFWLIIELKNMDTAGAFASILNQTNGMRSQLI